MAKKPNNSQALTQAEFGKRVGLSQGRISQLVRDGLPTEPNGLIDPDKGVAWINKNLDPERRRIGKAAMTKRQQEAPPTSYTEMRLKHLKSRTMINALEIGEREGRLIERKTVRDALFTRARLERDAWHGFAQRAAAVIASDTGAETAIVFAILDRLVRDQLVALSEIPVPFSDETAS